MKRLYAAFILVGAANTMLGPLMPDLESRWRIGDGRAGLVFMAMFLAAVAISTLTPLLGRRIGYRNTVALGMALIAAGVAGCTTSSFPLGLAAVAVYGCGIGLAVNGCNLAIAAISGGASARPLLWLNMCWSIGAMACPAIVAGLRGAFLPSLAATSLVTALAVAGAAGASRPRPKAQAAPFPHFLFALLLFLYVGIEMSVSGWVSTYATRGAEARLWAVLPSVFWAAILTGRATAPQLLHRIPPRRLAPLGLALGFAGACILLAGSSAAVMLAGTVLAGLGFAPVYPVIVAEYADLCGAAVSGWVLSAAGLGGAVIPPAVGAISTASGSLRIGLSAAVALLPVTVAVHSRIGRRSPASAPARRSDPAA
jgi:fucose permease